MGVGIGLGFAHVPTLPYGFILRKIKYVILRKGRRVENEETGLRSRFQKLALIQLLPSTGPHGRLGKIECQAW